MWLSIIFNIILLLAFLFTLHSLSKKQILDNNELEKYNIHFNQLKAQNNALQQQIDIQNNIIEFNNNKIKILQQQYKDIENEQEENLREDYTKRKKDFETEFLLYKQTIQNTIKEEENKAEELITIAQNTANDIINKTSQQIKEKEEESLEIQQRFDALLTSLKKYEIEQQQKLYYTIQVPDEYKNDIDYLLTIVSPKIQHPDIINKLIWTEYVKPYIEETFKRVNIKDESGIYKITNIDTGKCYIGKSTNVKKRLIDHFKSSIGITNIAAQAVHHEILRTGYWNWMIEPVIYCEKNKLNELEKYYINFFKSQEYGYNKNSGGGG